MGLLGDASTPPNASDDWSVESISNSNTQLKAFKYRLYPTPAQEKLLTNALNCARNLYNMCVAERKYAYQLEGRSVGKYEQLRQVKCDCGLSLDRDHNSSINILKRSGLDKSVKQNVVPLLSLNTSGSKRKRASEATRL
jgi:transposase